MHRFINEIGIGRELSYFKRIRKARDGLEVMLCSEVEFLGFDDHNRQKLASFLRNVLGDDCDNVLVDRKVPSGPPILVSEFKAWKSHWPLSYYPPPSPPSIEEEFSEEEKRKVLSYNEKLVQFASARQLENACMIIDPSNPDVFVFGETGPFPCDHAIMTALGRMAEKTIGRKRKHPSCDQYLCTGFYMFSLNEPCVMCGMAILHSRFKKVFYTSRTSLGAFESLYTLHEDKRLNHSFQVYRMPPL